MQRDFAKEFKDKCKSIDTPVQVKETIKRDLAGRYYNIHKRSLPIGIDKVVMMGLTKQQAIQIIEQTLKAKAYHEQIEDKDGQLIESKTLIYYDMIPEDAEPFERSIFYNTRPVIIDEKVY